MRDANLFLKILANGLQIDADRNSEGTKERGIADPRELQQLGGLHFTNVRGEISDVRGVRTHLNGASSKDNFSPRASSVPGCTATCRGKIDASGSQWKPRRAGPIYLSDLQINVSTE